jgi:hypothetical protein
MALAGATAPTLAETDDVQITQAVRDLAAQLGNDPVRMYLWVRNNVQWLPTYGSAQGSDLTLLTKRGNDVDTASLLIALYRAAGIQARYVYGTIEVPGNQMMNWVGGVTRPEAAQQLLGQGGIPNVAITGPAGITAVRLEHVWVQAFVDFAPSRGAVNRSPDTWVDLDPSFKQYDLVPAVDLASAVPVDTATTATRVAGTAIVDPQLGSITGLDSVAIGDWVDQITEGISYKFGGTLDVATFTGSRKTIVEQSAVLPAVVPSAVVARAATYDALPDSLRHKVSLTLYQSDVDRAMGSPSLTYAVSLPALAGKRLGVTWAPATTADAAALQSYRSTPGGTLPVYLIQVVPVVRLDDVEVARGQPVTMGGAQWWDVQLKDPGDPGSGTHTYNVTAGDEMVFGVDAQGIGQAVIHQRFTQRPSDTAAENLHTIALYYWAQHDALGDAIASAQSALVQRMPSIGLFSSPLQVAYLFGIPRSGWYGPRQMDVAHSVFAAVNKGGGGAVEFLRVAGLFGSMLEGRTFEALLGREAGSGVSAVELLREANEQQIPIHVVTATNFTAVAPLLHIDATIIAEIGDAVRVGKQVVVPERAPVHGNWSGVGYIVEDPATGAAAYLINGGLGGGGDDPCGRQPQKEPQTVPITEIVLIALLIIAIILLVILLGALAAGAAAAIADALGAAGLALARVVPTLAVAAATAPAAALAAPFPGDGMVPPGDCTPQQQATLQAAVDVLCHGTPSCRQFPLSGADCIALSQLTEKWRQCALARTAINTTCFKGGDTGHRIAEADAYRAWTFCLCRMGQNGCP